MARFLKTSLILLLALCAVGGVAFWFWADGRTAMPSADALADLVSDAQVQIRDEDNLVFRPAHGPAPRTGVIFYGGANADIRGYTTVLRRLAEEGFLVVAVRMPLNMAVFAPERALSVMEAYPETQRWVMLGHSMGGAIAGQFAGHHADTVAGLIIWDSYPLASAGLPDSGLRVWHIHRALPDGTPPEKFSAQRDVFPADSTWVPIPGGNHMNFGGFDGGGYVEDWEPSISRQEQHALVSRATLTALREIDQS